MTKNEKKDLTVNQKRILSRFDREVRRIIFNIEKSEENELSLGSMPISFCELDKKLQSLRIFLFLSNNKKSSELVAEMNKNFSSIIMRELARTKAFSRIPKVIFSIDKSFDYNEMVEKLLKES